MIKSPVLGLTLAVCCCILVTCSQARRISQRHDVVGPHEAPSLDMSGWRPVVDSGRPKLEQVAVSPTGYDGDSELVPPPRRNPTAVKVKKIRPQQQQTKGILASETRISTAFTALPPEPSSKRPVRFPDEKRRPVRRHRPVGVHLRPHVAQESAQHHVRFRPSPPAPEHFWAEPTEASVGYFTPQHYNDGHLHLAIAPQDQRQPISTQQVFGNPAFFNLEQPVRRPQDNTYLEPSIHENEVIQGIPHREVAPKYQITDPSSPPPRRRRPTRPPTTEESSYIIDPDMHRSPAFHEAPAWSTEQSVRPRRPKPTTEAAWQPQEEVEEEQVVQHTKPARLPAPVQEQLYDDVEQPIFKMKPRKPIESPPVEEQYHQEERVTLRPRRPRPTPQPVVQEDLEQEVSSPRPRTEEETRPLKRRRPRPPGEAVGHRRRRPRPRPQAPEPEVEEQQQQPEEERQVHRQPIQNWPTKISTIQEAEVTPENYPEIKEENYPLQEEVHNHQQHQQHHENDQLINNEPAHETNLEEVQSQQPAEEIPYAESSDEMYEQHPVSEEVNHQEPNEVTSTETLFSIPPKKKRPEFTTEAVSTTSSSTPSTTTQASTTSVISDRLRQKLNQTRPRFSLNNIKERLRQQQQSEHKDEQPAANTEPSRGRFRIGSSTTTEVPTTERSTFRPAMSRFTRPPFNSRYRSTTESSAVATTTDQMVTRRANPDIYSQNKERRPNLRRRTTEAPMTTTEEMEEKEVEKETESITEQMEEMTTMLPVSSTTPEDFSYAKRVTDLTSSATAFNPLSFFSAIPANGKHASQLRFTMATEDPILPIEAFFPTYTSSPSKPHGE